MGWDLSQLMSLCLNKFSAFKMVLPIHYDGPPNLYGKMQNDCVHQMCHKVISVTRSGDFWTLGKFLKPLATINFPKSPHILRQFL